MVNICRIGRTVSALGATAVAESVPTVPPSRPIRRTAAIGPMDAIPTRPKLSSSLFGLFLTPATPTPNARINGTVIGPVVAPPASKAMPR